MLPQLTRRAAARSRCIGRHRFPEKAVTQSRRSRTTAATQEVSSVKSILIGPILVLALHAAPIVVSTPIPVTGHGELFRSIPFVAPYYVMGFSGSNGADSVSVCCESGTGIVLAGTAGSNPVEGDYFTVDGVMSSIFAFVYITNNEITRLLAYDVNNPTNVLADVSVAGYFTNQVTTTICNGPFGCSETETAFDISPTPASVPEPPTLTLIAAAVIAAVIHSARRAIIGSVDVARRAGT
jgi:hypothetical protein